MSPQRNLIQMLDGAASEVRSAVRRGHLGESGAYLSAAAQMRKIVGTGQGNNLLARALPQATLHRLRSIPEKVAEESRSKEPGTTLIYHPGMTLSTGEVRINLPWERNDAPVPVEEWRRQPLLIAGETIEIGPFVQKYGDQEGAHADDHVAKVLSAVEQSGGVISVGGRPLGLAEPYLLALAEYVGGRVLELLEGRAISAD